MMHEFSKNLNEYSQRWFKLKQLANIHNLQENLEIQKQLEVYQLMGQVWQDCMMLRIRRAGL